MDKNGNEINVGDLIEIIKDLPAVNIIAGQRFVVSGLEYLNQVIVIGPNGAIVIAGRNIMVV